ncbi:MAG: hypothetical protein L0Z50_08395 [Verrucomicrobiales bacterium]|nr:hypothetical protein [Verrucomicrobiales bacterium]
MLIQQSKFTSLCVTIYLLIASVALGQGANPLVGIWTLDEDFQIVELLFRSDHRYQLNTKSTDPALGFSSSERGRYDFDGQALTLTPYEYFGEPQSKRYEFQVIGTSLSLTRLDFPQAEIYQLKSGSRADVLAREKVDPVLVRTWGRSIQFFGKAEYTFRPGGYYFLKDTPEDSQFPAEFIRGRYEQAGTRLTLKPYSGVEAEYEIDFFGNTLTLIKEDASYGESATYEELPGSEADVRAKAAEAEAFLSRVNWPVGVWEIRDGVQTADLTIRPDGHYSAINHTELLRGTVRGRYTLEPGRIHLFPFVGQDLYGRSNGEFGKVERTRELDYYDGELQFIDLAAISQSVTIARKRAGSEAPVLEKVRQAQLEREREGWYVGIWEVNDPAGWMGFTFRPDHRYIAQSGSDGVPNQVERGQFIVRDDKVTLAPYAGLGAARGFELDLYDGDLFLIGDLNRMVIARKVPGSETGVIEKTRDPIAMKAERGSILGLWTAHLPGQSSELVFRQDGQFRLNRCVNNVLSQDYGLYTANMATRTLVSDSRFIAVQTLGLDFYGDTMTIFGGLGAPSTYTVNLGGVDAAIESSFAADAAEVQIDQQWLARIPVGPKNPNAVQIPTGDIPADPNPGHLFEAPTVFTNYQLYRRLVPAFVYFNEQGTIKSVAVVNTREWHFFPTGRVMVRFTNHRAGFVYPATLEDVTTSWGAYHIDAKPAERDILHLYADNVLFIETDLGERAEMTLEDGRRHLFWNKDYQILSEWAGEQKPIPCQLPVNSNASLMNTGVSLSTSIEPDTIGDWRPVLLNLAGPVSGNFTLSGTSAVGGSFVIDGATSLAAPIVWQPLQTNIVPAGPFNFVIPQGTNATAYFRLRAQ